MDPAITSGLISSGITLVLASIGGVYGYGRLKGSAVTKKECNETQSSCQSKVCEKVDEVKTLVIDFHDKQSNRIEQIHDKMDKDKDKVNDSIKDLTKDIAQITGRLKEWVVR